MWKTIKKLFGRTAVRVVEKSDHYDEVSNGICPFCKNHHLVCGPEGPGAQNIGCDWCGARFNLLYYINQVHVLNEPTLPTEARGIKGVFTGKTEFLTS